MSYLVTTWEFLAKKSGPPSSSARTFSTAGHHFQHRNTFFTISSKMTITFHLPRSWHVNLAPMDLAHHLLMQQRLQRRNSIFTISSKMSSVIVWYGVATISRLLKIIGLFCRILSLFKGSFAKETYNFKEPTNRSHPIVIFEILFDILFSELTFKNLAREYWHTIFCMRQNTCVSKFSFIFIA